MSERKFTRGLGKVGMAAQLRETVSQVVRETTVQNKPHLVEPIDFESFVLKNKTLMQNDPQRELLLYPPDDVSQIVLPRRHRTVEPIVEKILEVSDGTESLLTKECLRSYASNWNLVHYKYASYSGTYSELPKLQKLDELKDEIYEIDIDVDQIDDDITKIDGITKEGYLMKGPDIGISDRMFVNIGSKSFKRRFCHLRQEVDGTYILELFKDDKKGETKLAIIMDFCTEVIRNPKRGRYCFDLKMSGTHKSYTFAADNENDMQEWLLKLTTVLQHYKQQEEKRAASLERTSQTPPPSPMPPPPVYGTLKGLEQSMNPQLIKYSRETDSSILITRRENRKKLFNFYNNNCNMTSVSKSNPTTPFNDMTIEPYKEQFGQRIFVKCETLKFRLQAPIDENETLCQVEPYQTTLCLFDARNGRKLSENFHFDINHEIVRDMTNELSPNVITNGDNNNGDDDDKKTKQNGNHNANGNGNVNDNDELPDDLKNIPNKWIMYPRQAIFSINNPHPDIFLVVRIEKILQGSICQTSEPYIRATKDPRLGLKVHKNVRSCCQRLGNYKMPFAWSARPLFRLYSNELDVSSDFPAIYRQEPNKLRDDDILKLLNEYRKPDKLSKLTIIPGWIKLTIEPLIDIPDNTLTTSLTPLKPFPLPPIAKPTIEIIEFDNLIEKDINPYTNYTNHLYIYPQTLNFDTQKIFNRARNIALVVELRDDDDCNDEKSLNCIYSKPGSNKILTKRVNCAVLHHNSIPSWYEEIKIRLPTKLHAKHHLLFSFYHISCDMNKKKDNTIENCVGYSWLLLLQKGKLMVDIDTNIQHLSVSTHLPPGYLSIKPLGLGKGNAGPDITWIDGQKQIFTVSYQLVSTVFTRDSHLHNFFLHAEKIHDNKLSGIPSDNETCKILKAAHAIQLTTAITFLPTILNQLFSLLTCSPAPSEQVGICIICLIIHLINLIHKAGRKDILKTYVKYVFVPPIKDTTSSSLSSSLATTTTTASMTTVHEQLAKYLPLLLQPSNPDFLVVNKFMHHSWFFFDIMVKSMAQHMLISERIKMRRNERFPIDYHNAIKQLIQIVTPYLMNKYKDMPIETHELNKSLGLFLKKCLTFMDRGFVFSLINNYMDNFKPGDPKILHDFKFTFLQIICSHEHYILFNLPMIHTRLTNNKDLMFEYCLSQDFCKHHFLVGLLLQEVKSSLNEVIQTRKIAITTLRDLLAKHELDDRYQNKGQLSRIASIYIPWLGIVLDNLNRFEIIEQQDPYKIEPKKQNGILSSSNSYLSNQLSSTTTTTTTDTPVKSINRFTLYVDTHQSPIRSSMHLRDSTYFAAIAGQSLENGYSNSSIASNNSTLSSASHSHVSQETTIARDAIIDPINTQNLTITNNNNADQNGHSRSLSVTQTSSPRFDKLQPSETKDILLCFLFVVKYLNDQQIIGWWQQLSDNELLNFFTIIEMSLYHFKYIGKRQITSSPSMINGKPKTIKSMTLPARMAPPDFITNNDSNNTTITTTTDIGTTATGTLQPHNTTIRDNLIDEDHSKYHQALLDANMSTEIGLITLDCVGLFCIHFKNILLIDGGDNLIMEKLFNIYLTYLQIGQSETMLRHVFASLRAFLNNYSIALFQGNAVFCGRLCYELLRCCNSKLSSIRQESCALLYLLMRSNFEFTSRKGITRVHLQVIISVSQMLGNVIGLNNSRFQESLSLINSYASSDKVMKGSGFPVEVKDLNKRIRTVLMATAQMREHNNDPEMLVDLQHSLANSYASTPELRHTWLETMARNHARDGNFSEAACCQLHIAALMAEYLKLKNMNSWGAEAFDKISINISKDERGLKLDAGEIWVQDIHYNESILLQQLESCAEMLEKAERFEVLGSLYRLIIPIYENKRNYVALSTCYSNLNNACTKIVEVTKTGKRLLGRFYRVAFFGSAYFEDENCQEYIYKEPKVTSLSEISERLHRLYSDKFGFENVKMIMDSAPIDQSTLDQKIAYIQVTHVTPYFEKYELDSRPTEFEQNHDICWFMFETPFTNDGKPRGNPEEQWKRRTIVKTDYYFPYIKKRIKIIDKKVISLSPIEVALDEMRQRVQELEDVALIAPADAKKLQLRLQGSVCVTVNAGPLAYASAFLDPALSPQYPDDKVEELKDVFREFVKICYTALQINSKLITNDQQEYQEVLRENYQKFCQNLSSLLGESVWPDEYIGSFKRNSSALFSAISGTNSHTSSA
ncbi:dedicator of cytokinesis protein 9 isoform X3 [Aphidius gifuensis]|uniref:dedicator of cytokinesis protein 9 isoform X3 n=1 Tax=Aphidius gifuensis TaxID=684658 RepID=UPI001CDCFC54|nr:dedicator of cytokinesis protein 9 isoform X3 [Aphidius gifuensis]